MSAFQMTSLQNSLGLRQKTVPQSFKPVVAPYQQSSRRCALCTMCVGPSIVIALSWLCFVCCALTSMFSSLLSLERLLFHTVVYAKCTIPERAANVQADPDRMQKDF